MENFELDCTRSLYVIHCHETGLFKIGITTNLKKRIRVIENHGGFRVFILAELFEEKRLGINARVLEYQIHKLFKEKRVVGEWFRLTLYDWFILRIILEDTSFNFVKFYKELPEAVRLW